MIAEQKIGEVLSAAYCKLFCYRWLSYDDERSPYSGVGISVIFSPAQHGHLCLLKCLAMRQRLVLAAALEQIRHQRHCLVIQYFPMRHYQGSCSRIEECPREARQGFRSNSITCSSIASRQHDPIRIRFQFRDLGRL